MTDELFGQLNFIFTAPPMSWGKKAIYQKRRFQSRETKKKIVELYRNELTFSPLFQHQKEWKSRA